MQEDGLFLNGNGLEVFSVFVKTGSKIDLHVGVLRGAPILLSLL